MRIGLGEFYINSIPDNTVIRTARAIFLNKIQEFAPKVWEELYEDCFTKYSDMGSQFRDLSWEEIKSISEQNNSSSVEDLYDSIINWAERNNLKYDWVLKEALFTLNNWLDNNIGPEELIFELPFYAEESLDMCIDPDEKRISLEFYWEPLVMTKEEFMDRVNRIIEDTLAKRTERISRLMEEKGYEKVPEKRIDRADHFKWFVLYHVLGRGLADIAQDVVDGDDEGEKSISNEAINKGILNAKSLLGIDVDLKN